MGVFKTPLRSNYCGQISTITVCKLPVGFQNIPVFIWQKVSCSMELVCDKRVDFLVKENIIKTFTQITLIS